MILTRPLLLDFEPQLPQTVILYADILSSKYTLFYNALKAKNINFILRYIPSSGSDQLYLSGYGAELAVKNTEYTSIDDRGVKQLDKNTIENLSRTRLDDKLPQIKKITKKQISNIAHKALAYASNFQELVAISEDFPKYAHLLVDTKISKQFNIDNEHTQKLGNRLMINGLELKDFNAFEILKILKSEDLIFRKFQKLGLDIDQSLKLLSGFEQQGWEDCFDVRNEHVIWLNDIEKNDRYSKFPTKIAEAVGYLRPNSFLYLKKNVFHVVLFVDFTNKDVVNELIRMIKVSKQDVPITFGFVPVIKKDGDVLILKAFEYLRLNPEYMESFLEMVI
jgi:UDP-glucose:glycoprotein glucosyltransferase